MKNWQKYITLNSEIRNGKPCVKGTRITVADILNYLASGMTVLEIIEDFPELNKESISAVLNFVAHKENITKIAVA
jgi:uncharacterized protein (DUF433 family)